MRRALVVCVLVGSLVPMGASADEGGDDEARARQLASMLDLDVQLDVIRHAPPPTTVDESIAHLHAVERAMVTLSRAELDADGTRARLQHEEFESKNAHDLVEAGHERSVARWNIAAVLVGSASAIVGAGTDFGDETAVKWGNGVLIAGAAVAAAFSIVALVKRDGGRAPFTIETNLLAPLFGRSATTRSQYPAWIWRYLDTPLAGAGSSIRQGLIDKWTREGRLPRHDRERRIALLCEPLGTARRIDADVLDDRADMLADVRASVAGLSIDLQRLWSELQAQR
jgi:hypothetical protein